MHITKKDVYWNYAATFLKMASSVLLLPFILKTMPSEMVAIWTVFITITAFSNLFDFGFNPSFSRNVTYIFSGVQNLKKKGIETSTVNNSGINYGLLKGIIFAMRWFYLRIAIILLIILLSIGTLYIRAILKTYEGNTQEAYTAWFILCIINSYNIFTLYYDSLLNGKGLIKKSKQIIIIGNLVYLTLAILLVMSNMGLIAIVLAQASSVIIIRWLAYRTFFSPQMKKQLQKAQRTSHSDILKIIMPNAVKIGLTSLGGFIVVRSSIIIGSLYLPLKVIASYGISMQLIGVITGFSSIFILTYIPKIAQLRVENEIEKIKEYYIKSLLVLILTFIAGGIILIGFGDWILILINSKTTLLPGIVLLIAIIISFLESNHGLAAIILVTKNEVPFYKASLISGALTLILLVLFLKYTKWGLLALILAPGISQAIYQNWKWPLVVANELKLELNDPIKTIRRTLKNI